MKKLIPFLFGTFWLLAAVSCYREEPAIGHLTVQLEFEHATDAVDITRIEVCLNNKNADFSSFYAKNEKAAASTIKTFYKSLNKAESAP